jgi:sulfate adenylyltransferase subunit 2
MTSQETTASPAAGQYELSHLRSLEAEAIHIIREVAAEFERPVLLFSGGKDSIVMLHLALKAFRPGRLPFPVMHVDTGHNFDEVITTRDELVAETGVRLVIAKVQDDIDAGRVVETIPSRNPIQTVTLLRAIRENKFDAAFGGARRDEEKARAKERVFSFRDEFGQWDPKAQRPELWNIYNGRHHKGEHIRVFPLSNWTEFDIWSYIGAEKIKLPPTGAKSSSATACSSPSTATCSRAPTRRCSRPPCGSAQSATSPAPAAWNPTPPPSPRSSPRRRCHG